MKMKICCVLILMTVLPIISFAQDKWELKKNEGGISVYTRKLDNEKFKEIRVIADLYGTTDQLMKILQNVNHHKDWVYGTKVSYFVNRKGKDTVAYYSEVSLPWPASNRDLVIQLCFAPDTLHKSLKIVAHSLDKVVPYNPNLVRVPFSLGLWNVTTLPNNHIKIDYTFSVNPGGSLPAWLVNSMATKGPFNTFKNLKHLLEGKNG